MNHRSSAASFDNLGNSKNVSWKQINMRTQSGDAASQDRTRTMVLTTVFDFNLCIFMTRQGRRRLHARHDLTHWATHYILKIARFRSKTKLR